MNTFTIYQGDSILLNRICENPPSLDDINLIFVVLEKSEFSNISYIMDMIQGDKYTQLHEHDQSIAGFMNDFINLCDGKFNFEVKLFLN